MKKLKKIPTFKLVAKEKKFWFNNDTSDYIDWRKAQKASFPNLKPSTLTPQTE